MVVVVVVVGLVGGTTDSERDHGKGNGLLLSEDTAELL